MNKTYYFVLVQIFYFQLSFSQKHQRDADYRHKINLEYLDTLRDPSSPMYTDNITEKIKDFVYLEPLWYSESERKYTEVKDEDIEKWLKSYNHRVKFTEHYTFVKVRKNFDSRTYVLCPKKDKKYFPDILSSKTYTAGVNLTGHEKMFESFFIDNSKSVNIVKESYYVDEVDAKKNLSNQFPLKFSKALTPFLLNDGLINGRAIIAFYNSPYDQYPSYYYNGFMKDGQFDGEGLLIEYHQGYTTSERGYFSHGSFQEKGKADSIVKNLLSLSYINRKLGIIKVDSFNYTLYKENFYFFGNEKYSIQLGLDVYARGEVYHALLNTRNTIVDIGEPFEIVSADKQVQEETKDKTPQIESACQNLTFQQIYSLWIAYNHHKLEDSLISRGATKINSDVYGLCYSKVDQDHDEAIYNYNELIQVGPNLTFSYGTFNREAYLNLQNYIASNYQYVGIYNFNGVNFKFYSKNNFFCSLGEISVAISKQKETKLYGIDFHNVIPSFYRKIE